MPRSARIVIPGLPHHVIQRGNRRRETFFSPHDYELYLSLLREWCRKFEVDIWGYCLMPNHVHLILVPANTEALARAMAEVHRRYTKRINSRENWKGFLWQCRFASYAMDNRHLLAAARYVELNPVKAGIVQQAGDYPWSSAAEHLRRRPEPVANIQPLLDLRPDWESFLQAAAPEVDYDQLQQHERSGKPAMAA